MQKLWLEVLQSPSSQFLVNFIPWIFVITSMLFYRIKLVGIAGRKSHGDNLETYLMVYEIASVLHKGFRWKYLLQLESPNPLSQELGQQSPRSRWCPNKQVILLHSYVIHRIIVIDAKSTYRNDFIRIWHFDFVAYVSWISITYQVAKM
jgi:hypothetical protein